MPVTRPDHERRQHPRVPAGDLPIQIQMAGQAPLKVRDLSRSGIAFYSESPIAMMTQVAFALEFPRADGASRFAEGHGVVVRCERLASALGHYEVAVFFSELSAEAAALVQGYVDQHLG
jgi:hypothetical protein